jgi:hypothetical protein
MTYRQFVTPSVLDVLSVLGVEPVEGVEPGECSFQLESANGRAIEIHVEPSDERWRQG